MLTGVSQNGLQTGTPSPVFHRANIRRRVQYHGFSAVNRIYTFVFLTGRACRDDLGGYMHMGLQLAWHELTSCRAGLPQVS